MTLFNKRTLYAFVLAPIALAISAFLTVGSAQVRRPDNVCLTTGQIVVRFREEIFALRDSASAALVRMQKTRVVAFCRLTL